VEKKEKNIIREEKKHSFGVLRFIIKKLFFPPCAEIAGVRSLLIKKRKKMFSLLSNMSPRSGGLCVELKDEDDLESCKAMKVFIALPFIKAED
jgi:hypothetical protein